VTNVDDHLRSLGGEIAICGGRGGKSNSRSGEGTIVLGSLEPKGLR